MKLFLGMENWRLRFDLISSSIRRWKLWTGLKDPQVMRIVFADWLKDVIFVEFSGKKNKIDKNSIIITI